MSTASVTVYLIGLDWENKFVPRAYFTTSHTSTWCLPKFQLPGFTCFCRGAEIACCSALFRISDLLNALWFSQGTSFSSKCVPIHPSFISFLYVYKTWHSFAWNMKLWGQKMLLCISEVEKVIHGISEKSKIIIFFFMFFLAQVGF